MNKLYILLIFFICAACNHNAQESSKETISVSIAPFKYFVDKISDGSFNVNIMVPPGSDPHIYEPYPGQIRNIRYSAAFISDGFLGFEKTWLARFYETNKKMRRLSLGDTIKPISYSGDPDTEFKGGKDPHFWVSLTEGRKIAASVKNLLCSLNPESVENYELNYKELDSSILRLDSTAHLLFAGFAGQSFMIYHPNLSYLARDYKLNEISVEYKGKEPTPSRMKELIDIAKEKNIKTIFIQKESDTKNARTIALEVGAEVKVIDPLSEDWLGSMRDIIYALDSSFLKNRK